MGIGRDVNMVQGTRAPLRAADNRDLAAHYARLRRVLDERRPQTPCLVIDLRRIQESYGELRAALPEATAYYAVKACPEPPVVTALARAGAAFDIASRAELDLCLGVGVPASRISYGNTVKKQADIAYAHAQGVRLYAFDSDAELRKLAAAAPGAGVVCRLLVDGGGAQWPLSRKFGCDAAMAAALLRQAATLGLEPAGVSFHVGSQQLDLSRWSAAIAIAASVFAELHRHGVAPDLLNLGGGFPTRYCDDVASPRECGDVIRAAVAEHFGPVAPQLMCEPGRSLVADAGVLRSEVVLVSHKSERDDYRWVYVDVGRFGGLAETEGEAIRYPLVTSRDGGEVGPVVLGGPTCDSVDVLYEHERYDLPLDLADGDTVDFLAAGAYTTAYASAFNGCPPPTVIYV